MTDSISGWNGVAALLKCCLPMPMSLYPSVAANLDPGPNRRVVRSYGPILSVEAQCRSCWCWAAVVVSVLTLPPWNRRRIQGELAYECISRWNPGAVTLDQCLSGCDTASKEPGDTAWRVDDAMRTAGIDCHGVPGVLDAAAIEQELKANPPRPVCIAIEWDAPRQTGAHVVAIVGLKVFDDGAVWLTISDPLYGPGTLVWSRDGRGYVSHTGRWTYSYLTTRG